MSSKTGLIILLLFLLAGLLPSCLESNKYEEVPDTEDAEILSFSLSSDSVPSLANVAFSIDQDRNLVYNHDSMAYQTEIKAKVIVNYTSAMGGSNVLNIMDGDSVWVKSGDSIDVSKPLLLKTFSLYEKKTKIYTFRLNIHQIDPDSVQYKQVASNLEFLQSEEIQAILFKDNFYIFTKAGGEIELYRSSDAVAWEKTPLSGLHNDVVIKGIRSSNGKLFAYTAAGDYYESTEADSWTKITFDYPIISILGYLKLGEGQSRLKEGLSLIVKKDDQAVFAFLSDENIWTFGDAVPSDFPVSDFASFSSERLKLGYLTIVGGLSPAGEVMNDVWSTGNGSYWAKLTNTDHIFPPLRGANVLYYNNEYWLLNGKLTDDTYNPAVYFSKDGGTTWSLRLEKCWVRGNYTKRCGATAVVDGKGIYFYIFGGKNDGFLPEIWKGYLNKRTF
jgi:hypothetical protein